MAGTPASPVRVIERWEPRAAADRRSAAAAAGGGDEGDVSHEKRPSGGYGARTCSPFLAAVAAVVYDVLEMNVPIGEKMLRLSCDGGLEILHPRPVERRGWTRRWRRPVDPLF